MNVKVLRTLDAFEVLADPWKSLVWNSYARSPFQLPSFLQSWWKTCGGGEWQNGELWLGVWEDADGLARGIAPLFSHSDRDGKRVFRFLGSREIADYLDFVVREEDAAGFIKEVLDIIAASDGSTGARLDLSNLRKDSPSKQLLIDEAEERGWQWSLEDEDVCPFIALDSDWDAYLSGLKKKYRHEIRRKLRRLAENRPDARFEVMQGSEVSGLMKEFLDMMREDPAKKEFLTDSMARFFHDLSEQAADEGWLRMASLMLDDDLSAAYLFFDFDGKIWLYNSGFHPSVYNLSPGWVLLSMLIQWSIDQEYRELDFMRGDETYKYRFGGINREVQRLQIDMG